MKFVGFSEALANPAQGSIFCVANNALKYDQIIQEIQLFYPTLVRYFAHTHSLSPATDLNKYPFFNCSIFLVIIIDIHLPTTIRLSIYIEWGRQTLCRKSGHSKALNPSRSHVAFEYLLSTHNSSCPKNSQLA